MNLKKVLLKDIQFLLKFYYKDQVEEGMNHAIQNILKDVFLLT